MAIFLVTYDLDDDTSSAPLESVIKEFDDWTMLSRSSYAIVTKDTVVKVYDRLQEHVGDTDQVYVVGLAPPFTGQGDETVNEWLSENLSG